MLFAQGWWLVVFAAGAVFLPYVAVVVANAGASPDPGGPEAFLADHETPRLEGPRTP